ncbi:MAG TPA: bifunctional [glutamate--ammonia ligase]-adenylyl-L-tyrosine phosphorylase/[glutamate--ammonia-ligase] adenylyltransferase, partial [Labilithrix sp.]
TKTKRAGDDDATRLAPLFAALDSGVETLVVTALAELAAEGEATIEFARAKLPKRRDTPAAIHEAHVTPDVARHLLALARRADLPLGHATRDKHPTLARAIVDAIAGAADPEQAARMLASFFSRLGRPGVYARALADDLHSLHKLVALFGASAFLGEALVGHPELADSVVFTKGTPTPEHARREVDVEVANANVEAAEDPGEALVSALRRAKARLTVEVGIAELAGELTTREATLVLTAIADATLEHATRLALAERSIEGGLSVVAMGKLGGREIGYGSDLDIFFVYDTSKSEHAEKYVRAAQRVLRLVSAPHGDGPGYELDTRLRPSGSHGLLVVSLEAFANYHGLAEDGSPRFDVRSHGPEAHDWERQALVKSRPCAGDTELGARVSAMAARIAYERPAPDPQRVNHLRMRMENELAREGPTRFDVKLGRGGIVDVEFAVQWLQMKYGADRRVRTTDTETALSALEACGYLDAGAAAVLREGYGFLRRLEQALRVVHGTSASLIEQGAPGLTALARRTGFREGKAAAAEALLERYLTVTRDVRAAYVTVLGLETKNEAKIE